MGFNSGFKGLRELIFLPPLLTDILMKYFLSRELDTVGGLLQHNRRKMKPIVNARIQHIA